MKKMLFEEILICSHPERKAKRIKLDPRRTLILGRNDVGKSSVIKTLMHTFGAKPAKMSDAWTELNPLSMVRFSVEDKTFSILKEDKAYAVFDSNDQLIKVCTSVTNELGPLLADLVDFKIMLPDKRNAIITPPPAYIFLPFYIDQDKSWGENWAGFSNLAQVKQGREAIIYYHTGIRGNEYYTTKNESVKCKEEYDKLFSERKAIRGLVDNLRAKISTVDFNINIDVFREEVEELLIECEKLKRLEEEHKAKLMDLYNLAIVLEIQSRITEAALKESSKDYHYAVNVLPDHIECPTCGAEYENSFAERFEIAKDRARCDELLLEINDQLAEVRSKIDKENGKLSKTMQEIASIEVVLQKKQGEIRLKDIIEKEGANQVREIFAQNLSTLNQDLILNQQKQSELEVRWKSLEDKEKKNSIERFYLEQMEKNLQLLEVLSLARSAYKGVQSKIKGTGSTLPRALMAYYFAIFETIKKYSTSVFCPLVIDSPNQQAQDSGHIDDIYRFIRDNQPSDTQMILGLEENFVMDFECPVVELKEKYSLLTGKEYDEVVESMRPFYSQVLSARGRMF